MAPVLTVALALTSPFVCASLLRAARRAESGERVRALQTRRRWKLPARSRARLQRALFEADVDIEPETAVQLWAAALFTAVMTASSVAPALVPVALIAVVVGAPIGLYLARARRERRFAAALPGALEQVAAELRGGGTVVEAVIRLAAGAGPVAADLRRVRARTRLGLGIADALARWPIDHDSPATRAAAGALAVAVTMGGRAADAIDGLATSLRHRLDAHAEARALSAQARLSAVVVGVAPIGYLAFSSLIDRSSVTVLVATGVGRVCLLLGLACEALAVLWIRHVLRSES